MPCVPKQTCYFVDESNQHVYSVNILTNISPNYYITGFSLVFHWLTMGDSFFSSALTLVEGEIHTPKFFAVHIFEVCLQRQSNPIKLNYDFDYHMFDWVQLVAELSWTQSNGLSLIGFYFTNQTHTELGVWFCSIAELSRTQSTVWVGLSLTEFDFQMFNWLCQEVRVWGIRNFVGFEKYSERPYGMGYTP